MPLIEAFNAREAIPDLYRLLDRTEQYGNGRVLQTLARMGDRDALPEIRKLLSHEEVGVRVEAVEALAMLEGPAAKEAVLEIFKDPQAAPYDALINTGAREAVPELKKRLTQYNPSLIQVLVALDAKDALPQILALLEKPVANQYFYEGLKSVGRAWPTESMATLRAHLTSGQSYDAATAAALLCEAGSSEGVGVLLEQNYSVFSLNALRRLEAWRRLVDRSLAGLHYGNGAELLERVAREAGFKVEGLPANAPEAKAWTGYYRTLGEAARPLRLVELMERLYDPRWAFILEEDTIRVLPREAAVKFWKEWWASAPRK